MSYSLSYQEPEYSSFSGGHHTAVTPTISEKHKEELMYYLYVSIIEAVEKRDPKTQRQLRDIDSVELYKQAKTFADSQIAKAVGGL